MSLSESRKLLQQSRKVVEEADENTAKRTPSILVKGKQNK
jgi:hypothetical protein